MTHLKMKCKNNKHAPACHWSTKQIATPAQKLDDDKFGCSNKHEQIKHLAASY